VTLVEQELPTLPEHMNSLRVISGLHATQYLVFCTDINPLISLGGIVSINELTLILEEEFEDNKGVIRIRISKKNRHHVSGRGPDRK
jgi:hypothetical protein